MSTKSSSSDGDNAPSEALMQLLAPDGYYAYLGIPKLATGEVDEDLIKKNYRKLSLKHHPDKRGGDSETFRVLNRAQKVLSMPKVRQQYDILGLDLDDDDDHNLNQSDDQEGGDDQPTTSQGIVHEVASMALTSIMQMGVRTRTLRLERESVFLFSSPAFIRSLFFSVSY
jgi:curved DNA-binding protein CbpA